MPEVSPARQFDSGAPSAMGKYAPIARLGNGGMADVFLAVARGPVGFNKLVVLKRLRNAEESANLRMFLDEARLCARLSHPNIVNTYEVGDSNGRHFIAMEYLEGHALRELLKWLQARHQGLPEPLAAYIAVQVLKGLHYAHELADYDGTPLGVVHRDVSPHNMMLTYGGEVKLLDFGIAKAAMNSTHTETGVLKGKVRYMAPEQVAEKNIDRRADICAFGIVMWEMLARRQLYTGDSISILTQIASQEPPLVSSVRPDVAPELEMVAHKALRRDPGHRYATAEEMRLDIEKYLRGKEGASDADLARLMTQAFGDVRDQVRARIKTFLAMLPDRDPDASSSGPRLEATSDALPVLLVEDSASGPKPPATSTGSVRSVTSTAVGGVSDAGEARPAPSRWPLIAVGAIALGAVAAVGVVALRDHRTAPVTAAAVAPAPTTARVHLATNPPGALIEVNGKPLDRSPADLVLDAGLQTVVVSREGYETEHMTLNLEPGAVLERVLELRATAAAPTSLASASAPPPNAAAAQAVPTRAGPSRSSTTAAPARATTSARPPVAATASAPRPLKIRVLDDSDSP